MDEIELLRETMLRQELIFKEQVRELHRVYQRQKILMTDTKAMNLPRDQRFGTMDLLYGLEDGREEDRIDSSGFSRRAKRQKTFDLEQIPDDNDEDTEYVFDTSSRPSTSSITSEEKYSRRNRQEIEQPSRPLQEMALFPTLPSGRELLDGRRAAKNGSLDWQLQANQFLSPWIGQNLGRTGQVGDPWNISGAQFTGQSYQAENYGYNPLPASPEMMMAYTNNNPKHFAPSREPYSYITQEILKNSIFTSNNQTNLSSRTSTWFSSANNITSNPMPPLVENNLLPKLEKVDTAAAVSDVTHALDSEKSLSRRKYSGEDNEDVKIDNKFAEKNRVVGAGTSCTGDLARDLELQDASTTNSVVINSVAVEVGLSKARTMVEDSLDLVAISDDTITWAATILLSFSPRCSTTTLKLCKNRDVEGASKPGVSDLKLFKSVVAMLKHSGGKLMKSGRKFVVSNDDQSLSKGKAIAALFERTLSSATKEKDQQHQIVKKRRRKKKIEMVAAEEEEEEHEEEERNEDEVEEEEEEEEEELKFCRARRSSLRESVHSNGSAVETMTRTTAATPPPRRSRSLSHHHSGSSAAAAAAQTQHTWLWGDVTRRKRMQRPRHQQPTLRPQHHQVRCQN